MMARPDLTPARSARHPSPHDLERGRGLIAVWSSEGNPSNGLPLEKTSPAPRRGSTGGRARPGQGGVPHQILVIAFLRGWVGYGEGRSGIPHSARIIGCRV